MKGLTLKEAFLLCQPGQFIKAIGDSFNGNVGYFGKEKDGRLFWSNGASGYYIEKLSENGMSIYGIYSKNNDFSRIL